MKRKQAKNTDTQFNISHFMKNDINQINVMPCTEMSIQSKQ